MSYFLIIGLMLELAFIYCANGKNIVSPSFIACGMFIFSTFMFIMGRSYFLYEISLKTVLTVCIFCFFIFIGEYCANRYKLVFSSNHKSCHVRNNEYIKVSQVVIMFFSIFVLIVSVYYFLEVYKFSLKVGNRPGNYFLTSKYVRESHMYSKSFFVSQGTLISECIVYLCVYIYCNNQMIGKKEKITLLPVVCYLPSIFAANDRSGLLRTLTIICMIIFVFVKKKDNWTSKSNFRIIKIGLFCIVFFLIVFRLLGYRTETSIRNPLIENILEYTAASLVGLDMFLTGKIQFENVVFGQSTLKYIYYAISEFGFDIPEFPRFNPFYFYGRSANSNIYTGLQGYIQDYSYIGGLFAMFFWGYFITTLFNKIRDGKDSFFNVCVMGMIFYPVVMISIGDVTSSVLCLTMIYTIVYLKLLQYYIAEERIQTKVFKFKLN